MIDEDDDERRGGCGRSSSVRDVEVMFLVASRERTA